MRDLKKQLKMEQKKIKKLEEMLESGSVARDSPQTPLGQTHRRTESQASLRSFGGSQESLNSSRSSINPAARGGGGGGGGGGGAASAPREPPAAPQLSSDEHTQLMMRVTAMQVNVHTFGSFRHPPTSPPTEMFFTSPTRCYCCHIDIPITRTVAHALSSPTRFRLLLCVRAHLGRECRGK
jgi:hypothetical protein